jgi:multiple sugar transport system substrate-binding protein
MPAQQSGSSFTRRGFLGVGVGAAATAFLAACSSGGGTGGSGGSSGPIKFWNQPWGGTAFNPLDKQITTSYKPKKGLPSVTYQVVQWNNFIQTYSSAVASGTNPALSSGGFTQAFMFERQGKIAYADDLLDQWKKNGMYDDFLPGLVDTLHGKNGQVSIPYNLDMRVMWYSKSLLEKAGVQPPTNWDEYEKVCAALKKIGVYGYGTQGGSGGFTGQHNLVSHMINNGGGLFNADHQPDCVTPENIQAMEWVLGLVKNGYVDPRAVSYTPQNAQSQWKAGKYGMGWDTGGLANNLGGKWLTDVVAASPLTGPTGKKGALFFPNQIEMYKKTPSKEGTEAFATYYYKNMAPLWTKKTGIGLPVLKSIADTPEFKQDANAVKIIQEWQPISKTFGSPGSNTVFYNLTTVDATPPLKDFTQAILSGRTTAKAALENLQKTLEPLAKKDG